MRRIRQRRRASKTPWRRVSQSSRRWCSVASQIKVKTICVGWSGQFKWQCCRAEIILSSTIWNFSDATPAPIDLSLEARTKVFCFVNRAKRGWSTFGLGVFFRVECRRRYLASDRRHRLKTTKIFAAFRAVIATVLRTLKNRIPEAFKYACLTNFRRAQSKKNVFRCNRACK